MNKLSITLRTASLFAMAVTLGFVSCATERATHPSDTGSAAALGPSRKAPTSGPLTWLHSREPFTPKWEDWDEDELGARHLIIDFGTPSDSGLRQTTIILEKDRLHCRSIRRARSEWGLVAEFFFKPGTAEPVAYSGAGYCIGEPPFSETRDEGKLRARFACGFDSESSVEIHGYAWPFERDDEESAKSLSEERIEAIDSRLKSTALPDTVSESIGHGSRWTRAPIAVDEPVMGVFVSISDPKIGDGGSHPIYLEASGPPLSKAQFDELRSFVDEQAVARTKGKWTTANTWFSLDFWTSNGTRKHYSASLLETDRPVKNALVAWSRALAENGCQVSDVGSPTAYIE